MKIIFNCCGSHYKWILIDERLALLLCDLDLNWDLLITANVCCLREWHREIAVTVLSLVDDADSEERNWISLHKKSNITLIQNFFTI